jgi:NAD(P)-dependent dehydrogenase (short-subunit alcohol dehydrogenase family)
MKSVVVTGARKGLGRGLAQALLARGCRVTLTGRNADEVARAAAALSEAAPDRVLGVAGDVGDGGDVQRAWDASAEWGGAPDVWVNNAGYAIGNSRLDAVSPEDLEAMVRANLLGTLLGSRTAVRGLQAAGKPGAIYNLYGAGADGAYVPGMTAYGTSKVGVPYLTRALAKELEGGPILVCGFQPGLVITEGWLREHAKVPLAAQAARIAKANLLADHVETVAAWMAEVILTNARSGRSFRWLTPAKLQRRKEAREPRDILSRYIGAEDTP